MTNRDDSIKYGKEIADELNSNMFKDGINDVNDIIKEIIKFMDYISKTIDADIDPVTKILYDIYIGCILELRYSGKQLRLKYDADARFFSRYTDEDNALRGDTMISFWKPYTNALRWSTMETKYYNYAKSLENISQLIENITHPLKKDKYIKVGMMFKDFAQLYHSPGNFIFLRERGMNTERHQKTEDRIDKTLYECFPNGNLCHYFGDDEETQMENLRDWIIQENLNSPILFQNSCVERDMVIALNGCGKEGLDMNYFIMARDGLLEEYIKNVTELIIWRNDKFRNRKECQNS